MKIYGVINHGEFSATEEQARLEAHDLKQYKDGTLAVRMTQRYSQPRTQHQLGAHFGLALTFIIETFNDRGYDTSIIYKLELPTGIGVTKDLLKDFFYSACPIFDGNGDKITLGKASIEQTAKHFDDIRNYAASQWQIVIPEPNKDWKNDK